MFDLRLKYRAIVRTSATPLWLRMSSMFLHAARSTTASVASALGPFNIAYTFSPATALPAELYLYFCLATFNPCDLKISPSFSATLARQSRSVLFHLLPLRRPSLLLRRRVRKSRNLVPVCSKHIMLAAPKVCMDLPRQKGVLGDVRPA